MSGPTSWNAADARILDTNLLLYAYDPREKTKRPIARRLMSDLIRSNRLCLPVQVLNEFFWNATRAKRRGDAPILSVAAATGLIQRWCSVVPVFILRKETTLAALDGMPAHSMNFWDALLWASARENGVPVIYTEDFQHGQTVAGVQYVNPFLSTAPGP